MTQQAQQQIADAVTAILERAEGAPSERGVFIDPASLSEAIQAELERVIPVLNEDEQEAWDLLGAFMRKLQTWGLRTNEDELAAAVHVLQGFVVQHMLRRCVPQGAWSAWYKSQSDDERERVDADVPRLEVELLEPFAALDSRMSSPNWASLPDTAMADIRALQLADVGAVMLLEQRLAARLMGFDAARLTDSPINAGARPADAKGGTDG